MSGAFYVYAIVRRDTPLPVPAIWNGAPELAMVRCRELAAVTGRMEAAGAPVTIEAMLHHEAVVEAVRRQGPALPVRFGTVFRDATSVASALADRYELLVADLDRLGNKVELGLTALWAMPLTRRTYASPRADQAPPAGQSAGSRYLYARAVELRQDDDLRNRARMVAEKLEYALGGKVVERRVSLIPTPGVAVRAAFLLDPADEGGFRAAFDALRQDWSDVRLLLTGPWPPYSFVGRTETVKGTDTDDRLAELAQILTRGNAGPSRLNGREAQMDN